MGDMREIYDDMKEAAKEHKASQKEHIKKFIDKQCNSGLIEFYTIINKSAYQYRLTLPSGSKIDVWLSTSKHTLVGSNKFHKGMDSLKKMIKEN